MRLLLSALACWLLVPAAARAADLPIDPGAAFEHRHSHIRVPPTLAGLPRVRVAEFAPDQLDVAFNFADPEANEVVTLYVYRLAAGSLPIWFDRARWIVEHNNGFGGLTPLTRELAFTPPGQANASGLIAVYAAEGRHRSTGIAMVPVGEWLVKLRLSSASLSPEQLRVRIATVLGELKWPQHVPPAPAAVPIADCAAPLVLAGPAKPISGSGEKQAGTLLISADAFRAAPESWCRDPAEVTGAAVYRSGAESDAYLLALADAGRAVRVQPAATSPVAGGARKPAAWSVDFIDLGRVVSFSALDALPPPGQALEIISKSNYVAIASTWGTRTVQLNPDKVP